MNIEFRYNESKTADPYVVCEGENCMKEELTDIQIQRMGFFNKFSKVYRINGRFDFENMDNFVLEDKNRKRYGGINSKGKIFADFIYTSFEKFPVFLNTYNESLYLFYKNDELADLYLADELLVQDIKREEIFSSSVIVNSKVSERYLSLHVLNRDGKFYNKVYDIKTRSFIPFNIILHDNMCIYEMDVDEDRFIYHYENSNDDTISAMFDKKKNHTIGYKGLIHFTKNFNYFVVQNTDKNTNANKGLMDMEGKIVFSEKYKEILQVFNDKAVVINSKNRIRVIHFSQNSQKGYKQEEAGNYYIKQDNYKLTEEVVNAYFLEDESDAILTLNTGKKILLSHYLTPNHENFICSEIINKENGIFQCIYTDENNSEIIYYSYGMSVSYNDTDEKPIVISKSFEDGVQIFQLNGKMLYSEKNSIIRNIPAPYRADKYFHDFMTTEKNGKEMLVYVESISGHKYFNLYTGEDLSKTYGSSSPFMVFHNLCYDRTNHIAFDIRSNVAYEADEIISFNDYCFISSNSYFIVLDKEMNEEIKMQKQSDSLLKINENNNDVVFGMEEQFMFRLSNDGIQEFEVLEKNGKPVLYNSINIYKDKNASNHKNIGYIANNVFITEDVLNYEMAEGFIPQMI